jgi:hypothetical protein
MSALFARMCSHIEIRAIFFETNIMSDLIPFANRMTLSQWRFVNQILLLARQIIFRILKKANAFWLILH